MTMKSKLLILTSSSLATALVGCSDDSTHLLPANLNPNNKTELASVPETAMLYKVTSGEDGCRDYQLEKEVTLVDAADNDVDSPLGLCEEKLKPELNSQYEKYDREKVQFSCFKKSLAPSVISKYKSCYEVANAEVEVSPRVGAPVNKPAGPTNTLPRVGDKIPRQDKLQIKEQKKPPLGGFFIFYRLFFSQSSAIGKSQLVQQIQNPKFALPLPQVMSSIGSLE